MITTPEAESSEVDSERTYNLEIQSAIQPPDGAQVISPWIAPDFFGPKPEISPYGFVSNKQPVPCESFYRLRSYIAWDKQDKIKQIWVPEFPFIVTPEEVPYLFRDVFSAEQKQRKQSLQSSLSTQLIWVLFGFSYITRDPVLGVLFILSFVGVPVLQRVWDLRKAPQYSQKNALEDAEITRFGHWTSKARTPLTYWLGGAIAAIWLIQLFASFYHIGKVGFGHWSPSDAVGLVKSAVWYHGEWWRLFTATVMHTIIWHIFFNVLVLIVLGKVVEAVADKAYVAIVFLVSALLGSVFSLLLLPATSIGSSGGIMGLLGFILALGHFRRGSVPQGFVKSLLSGVGLIFLAGLFGFLIIDNAAHFGGLLGGLGIGYIAAKINTSNKEVPLPATLSVRILGVASTGIIAATIVTTAAILILS